MRTMYHGAPHIVNAPLCHIGRDNLDFGKGFYLTDIRQQAINWATRITNLGLPQWLNVYEIDYDYIITNANCKIFKAYDEEWLQFIVDSRNGRQPSNNQVCILSQHLLDKSLRFVNAEPLNDIAKRKEEQTC